MEKGLPINYRIMHSDKNIDQVVHDVQCVYCNKIYRVGGGWNFRYVIKDLIENIEDMIEENKRIQKQNAIEGKNEILP